MDADVPGIAAPWPWWTTALGGRIYRPVMRLMHRRGWCFAPPTLTPPHTVWCHWCGMRGRVPMTAVSDRKADRG